MERLSELNALLNMDDKDPSEALGMDEGAQEVADCPRKAVTLAGRVSEASRMADETRKPSVLGKLKEAKDRIAGNHGNSQKSGKKWKEIRSAVPFVGEDEEMLALINGTLEKMERITEEEFLSLNLEPYKEEPVEE